MPIIPYTDACLVGGDGHEGVKPKSGSGSGAGRGMGPGGGAVPMPGSGAGRGMGPGAGGVPMPGSGAGGNCSVATILSEIHQSCMSKWFGEMQESGEIVSVDTDFETICM